MLEEKIEELKNLIIYLNRKDMKSTYLIQLQKFNECDDSIKQYEKEIQGWIEQINNKCFLLQSEIFIEIDLSSKVRTLQRELSRVNLHLVNLQKFYSKITSYKEQERLESMKNRIDSDLEILNIRSLEYTQENKEYHEVCSKFESLKLMKDKKFIKLEAISAELIDLEREIAYFNSKRLEEHNKISRRNLNSNNITENCYVQINENMIDRKNIFQPFYSSQIERLKNQISSKNITLSEYNIKINKLLSQSLFKKEYYSLYIVVVSVVLSYVIIELIFR